MNCCAQGFLPIPCALEIGLIIFHTKCLSGLALCKYLGNSGFEGLSFGWVSIFKISPLTIHFFQNFSTVRCNRLEANATQEALTGLNETSATVGQDSLA